MSAPDGVLVQSNFKSPGGSLHNVYGTDEQSFDLGLAILQDRIATLASIEQQLQGAGNVAAVIPLAPTQPAPVPAAPAAVPPGPAPSFLAAAVPACPHGQKVARSGQGAKGPWKAWMCPAPKGTPGQCEPAWVRKGSPEWDTFPA